MYKPLGHWITAGFCCLDSQLDALCLSDMSVFIGYFNQSELGPGSIHFICSSVSMPTLLSHKAGCVVYSPWSSVNGVT